MSDFESAQGGWMLCEEASDAIDALESEMLRLAVKGREKISALEAENERMRDLLKQCEDAVWSAGYERLWDSIRSVRKAKEREADNANHD